MKLHYFEEGICPSMWASHRVHIVHAVRNNTLCEIGLITRWSLFFAFEGGRALHA